MSNTEFGPSQVKFDVWPRPNSFQTENHSKSFCLSSFMTFMEPNDQGRIYLFIYLPFFFLRKHVNFCDLTGQVRQGLARQSVSQALPYVREVSSEFDSHLNSLFRLLSFLLALM